jgi:hypothetical protein
MSGLSLKSAWVWCAALLGVALLPDLLEAGSIGWSDMAADASDSFMGMAGESVPILVGAGLVAGAWHLSSVTGGLLATGAATYGAANGDQIQGMIGGGGGGGLITDIANSTLAYQHLLI